MKTDAEETRETPDAMAADDEVKGPGDAATTADAPTLLYSVLDTPPWHEVILLGLQHLITMMSGTAIIPTIFFNSLCLTDMQQQSAVVSTTFFVMGLATLLQTLLGTRLPIIQGSSAVFVATGLNLLSADWLPQCSNATAIANQSTAEGLGVADGNEVWMDRLSYISGTLALSSLFQMLCGLTGLTSLLIRLLSPVVIAPTICLIGLSLIPVAAESASTNWYIAVLVCVLITLFSYVIDHVTVPLPTVKGKKFKWISFPLFKSFPVLLSVGICWCICGICTVTNLFPPSPTAWSHSARTDIRARAMAEANWVRLPYPGQFGRPRIVPSAIIGMCSALLLSIIESIGDYATAARMTAAPLPPAYAVNRGILCEGIGCLLAGMFGLPIGTTSYSENIGAIGITGVGSRRVIQAAACFMLLFGICPKIGAIFVSLPAPVVGGLFITMFGMVTGVGLSNLQAVDLSKSRSLFIVGFSIFLGLCVPHWIRPASADLLAAAQGGGNTAMQVAISLLSTEVLVGGLTAILLNSCLRGSSDLQQHQQDDEQERQQLKFYDIPYGRQMFGGRKQLSKLPFCANYE